MIVAFAVDRPVPSRFLMQHDFAIGVERGGERAAAGHASIKIAIAPRPHGGMHIAVGGVQLELVLDDRRQAGFVFHGPSGFGVVATRPGRPPLAVRQAADHVLVPKLVDGRKVGVVVVALAAVSPARLVIGQGDLGHAVPRHALPLGDHRLPKNSKRSSGLRPPLISSPSQTPSRPIAAR